MQRVLYEAFLLGWPLAGVGSLVGRMHIRAVQAREHESLWEPTMARVQRILYNGCPSVPVGERLLGRICCIPHLP